MAPSAGKMRSLRSFLLKISHGKMHICVPLGVCFRYTHIGSPWASAETCQPPTTGSVRVAIGADCLRTGCWFPVHIPRLPGGVTVILGPLRGAHSSEAGVWRRPSGGLPLKSWLNVDGDCLLKGSPPRTQTHAFSGNSLKVSLPFCTFYPIYAHFHSTIFEYSRL